MIYRCPKCRLTYPMKAGEWPLLSCACGHYSKDGTDSAPIPMRLRWFWAKRGWGFALTMLLTSVGITRARWCAARGNRGVDARSEAEGTGQDRMRVRPARRVAESARQAGGIVAAKDVEQIQNGERDMLIRRMLRWCLGLDTCPKCGGWTCKRPGVLMRFATWCETKLR